MRADGRRTVTVDLHHVEYHGDGPGRGVLKVFGPNLIVNVKFSRYFVGTIVKALWKFLHSEEQGVASERRDLTTEPLRSNG